MRVRSRKYGLCRHKVNPILFSASTKTAKLGLLFCHLQASIGTLQRIFRPLVIHFSFSALEEFFGTLAGFLRAFHINFFWPFGCFSKDGYFVRQNFGEPPSNRQMMS